MDNTFLNTCEKQKKIEKNMNCTQIHKINFLIFILKKKNY